MRWTCAFTVAVFFKPAGGAAQLKVSVVKVLRTDRCDYVIKWLRKALQLKPSDALVRDFGLRRSLCLPCAHSGTLARSRVCLAVCVRQPSVPAVGG